MRTVGRLFRALHRALTAVFRVVARVLAVPLLTITFLVGVVFPWAIPTFLKGDPTWAPRRPASRWVPRDERRARRVAALWSEDPAPRALTGRRQARMLLPRLFLVVGLSLGVKDLYRNLAGVGDDLAQNQLADGTEQQLDPSLVDRPWMSDWADAFDYLQQEALVDLYTGSEYPDVGSPHLNVTDGVRSSWSPPTAACATPLRVWMFGGSTLFGVGQRDDHTIASELARAAWRDGVALDVDNRAVPGDVAWIERARLRRALITEDTPDLVVFYDGFNDVRSVEWSYGAGHEVTNRFSALNDATLVPLLKRLNEREIDGERTVVAVPLERDVRPPDQPVIDDAVRFQYGATRSLTDADLARAGVASIAFIQPIGASRNPLVAGDFPTTRLATEQYRTFRDGLPEGVVDIADALDDHPGAVYVDDVHTTEEANPVIATRMWNEMRELVASLAAPDPSCPAPPGP